MYKFYLVLIILIIKFLVFTETRHTPIIFPKDNEIIFDSKLDITLGCTGKEPVKWTLPESISKKKIIISNVNISNEKAIDQHYNHGSLLTVKNATVFDIGYYICFYDYNPTKAKKIYVYVRDENKLISSKHNRYAITIQYFIHLNLTLPCIPTTPDISVKLMQLENVFKEVPKNLTKFHPTVGFTLKTSEIKNQNQIYMCIFQYNNVTQNLTIDTQAKGVLKTHLPYISVLNKYVIKHIGDNLELNCSLITDDNTFNLDWEITDKSLNQVNRLSIIHHSNIPIQNNNFIFTQLIIKNITTAESGTYKCYISPGFKQDLFSIVHVLAIEKGLELTVPEIYSNVYDIFTYSNLSQVTINSKENITLYCRHHSNITWSYSDAGFENILDLQKEFSIKYFTTITNGTKVYYSLISLKNAIYSNGGFYYCHETAAEIEHPYKSSRIFLFVKDNENLVLFPPERNKFWSQLTFNFWIPCIPTSPDVSVKIVNINLNKKLKYDPRFGFYLNRNILKSINEDITCEFLKGDYLEHREIFIHINNDISYELKPFILEPISNEMYTTNDLILTCTMITLPMDNTFIKWSIPNRNRTKVQISRNNMPFHNKKVIISVLKITNLEMNDEGSYKCFYKNIVSQNVYIKVKPLFNIKPFIYIPLTTKGDNLLIKCTALVDHNIHFDITWSNINYTDKRIIVDKTNYITNIKGILGVKTLLISNITFADQRNITCHLFDFQNNTNSISTEIIIKEAIKPIIYKTNMNNTEVKMKLGKHVILMCLVKGYPMPNIIWTKNNIVIKENDPHIEITSNKTILKISYLYLNDSGIYSCNATNRVGSDFKKIRIMLNIHEAGQTTYIVIIILLIVFLLIFLLFCIVKLRKMKKFSKKLEIMRYKKENIDDAALNELIDPEFLQYIKTWELPHTHIKLRERIGAGNFGLVMKADFLGTNPKKTVAVKIIKNCLDSSDINMFTSELKIMINHAGKHVNIINLIGVCTNNLNQGELLIVIDYCKFGNLRNFLLINRDNYLENAHILDNQTLEVEYVNVKDNFINKTITKNDLIFWSFQVANGMEYLSSKNVIHGDLAARNILLTENNIIKICDFGLSKSLYNNTNYKNKKQVPLPIKWMAIESIRDGIFSIQSDVWSFAIVLWEIFTLAKTPYSDLLVDSKFYKCLVDGYRMEQPEYSSKEIYQVMLDCWNDKPCNRPSFEKIVQIFHHMLEITNVKYYKEIQETFVDNKDKVTHGNTYIIS